MQAELKKKTKQQLLVEHLDDRMSMLALIPGEPARGWINSIRLALRMSYRQLAIRLGITAQNARRLEMQEQNAGITLKTCREIATSLNMRFVYGFVVKDGSLADIIDKQAHSVANKLIKERIQNLDLDEPYEHEDIEMVTAKLAEKLKENLPRNLWNKHK